VKSSALTRDASVSAGARADARQEQFRVGEAVGRHGLDDAARRVGFGDPRLDRAEYGVEDRAARSRRGQRLPRLDLRMAALEGERPTSSQCSADRRQGVMPVRIGDEELRDVAGHELSARREASLDPVAEDPAHAPAGQEVTGGAYALGIGG